MSVFRRGLRAGFRNSLRILRFSIPLGILGATLPDGVAKWWVMGLGMVGAVGWMVWEDWKPNGAQR